MTVVAVVDDDPTGMQAVSGVPVLFEPDDRLIEETVATCPPALFVLTNSRALPEADAVAVNRRVGAALARAARAAGVDVRLVSRSDSTLRGHFPAEPDALREGWVSAGGAPPHATVLCPAFPDAGRVTVAGMHFVRDGDGLVPVALTEAARDPTFGYAHSDLGEWVAERAPDRVVRRVTLEHLRGASAAAQVLCELPAGGVATVDALDDGDLAAAAKAVAEAERQGRRFVFRTGPSLVRALAGLPKAATLGAQGCTEHPGLVVVGSHTARTTEQLTRALDRFGDRVIELDAVGGTVEAVRDALTRGTTVVHTDRTPMALSLQEARAVSLRLVEVVRRVLGRTRVGYVVAKGGITSHDIGCRALGITRATVRGNLLDGIVSMLAPDGSAPPFVIFPGNVGDADALRVVLDKLESRA